MRFKAIIEYDGTAYCGFQKQRSEPTIQQELELAIFKISSQETTVLGAGRTDSGVHARGQVIAFDLFWKHDQEALKRALNAILPADIAINFLVESREDFQPRFEATRRTYEYYIYNHPVRSPIRRRTSWHVNRPLNIDHMNSAAKLIVGEHDFSTFGRPPQGINPVRQVFLADWQRQKDILKFTIEANAFLFRMVRSLVGCMKAVGEGKWTVEDFEGALKASDRHRAAKTAPAHPLFLISVKYE